MRTVPASAHAVPSGPNRRGRKYKVPRILQRKTFLLSPTKWFRKHFSVSRKFLVEFRVSTLRKIGLSLIKLGGHLNKRKMFFPQFRSFKRTVYDLLKLSREGLSPLLVAADVKRVINSLHTGLAHYVRWARRIGVYKTYDLEWKADLPRRDITFHTVLEGAKREELCTGKVKELLEENLDQVVEILSQDPRPQWQSLRRVILVLDRLVDEVQHHVGLQEHWFCESGATWRPNDLGVKRCFQEVTPLALRHGDVDGDVVDEISKSLKYYSTSYSPSNPYDYDEDPYLEEMLDQFADY